jgi:hypothetical protein
MRWTATTIANFLQSAGIKEKEYAVVEVKWNQQSQRHWPLKVIGSGEEKDVPKNGKPHYIMRWFKLHDEYSIQSSVGEPIRLTK